MKKEFNIAGEDIKYNSDTNQVELMIREPFYTAGIQLNWDKRIKSPAGISINAPIYSLLLRKQATLLIKLLKRGEVKGPFYFKISAFTCHHFLKRNDSIWMAKKTKLYIIPLEIMTELTGE